MQARMRSCSPHERRRSLIHADRHVSRLSYLSPIDQDGGVFGFFPSRTLPNNSMVVLVQMAP